MLPAIFSLSTTDVTVEEAALFAKAQPVGFILFARNIVDPGQLRALTARLRDVVGRDCPILIDQEGGRVARLKSPHWPEFLSFEHFGKIYGSDPETAIASLRDATRGIAGILNDVGINVNCSPVLDVRFEGAHDIIGNRAFSTDPKIVALLGDVVASEYLAHGITPILKHAPGHGRALGDSHHELPTVDVAVDELDATDFYPFAEISKKPYAAKTWLMTAHILYPRMDAKLPATLSKTVMEGVVRGRIGYPGVIIGDDMDMKALDSYGDIVTRSIETLNAGCDLVLNCWGKIDDMAALAARLPQLGDGSVKRLAASRFGHYAA
jgi:beta-N-acetylhexosaminidase